jgi:hypothetical protein
MADREDLLWVLGGVTEPPFARIWVHFMFPHITTVLSPSIHFVYAITQKVASATQSSSSSEWSVGAADVSHHINQSRGHDGEQAVELA